METPQEETNTNGEKENAASQEIKGFYRNSFPRLLRLLFTQPISGVKQIFETADEKTYLHSVILIVSSSLLFMLLLYFKLGAAAEYIGLGYFFKLALLLAFWMIVISGVSFAIKSATGKADFKKELLTGALCGIPFLCLTLIVVLFGSIDFSNRMLDELKFSMVVILMAVLYTFLFLVNIVQQSLKAARVNDFLSWYISPVVVGFSFYMMYLFAPSVLK